MQHVLIHALFAGLALSVLIGALLLVVLRANAEIMLHDYPPDIRAAWGPMTSRTKRQKAAVAALLFVVILAAVSWSIVTLPIATARELPFSSAFAYFAVMFGTFNVFDWLVIDCGLVYFQPKFVVLPGTAGMAGYRDYRFHFRGFLIGIPVVLVGSALAAAAMPIVLQVLS